MYPIPCLSLISVNLTTAPQGRGPCPLLTQRSLTQQIRDRVEADTVARAVCVSVRLCVCPQGKKPGQRGTLGSAEDRATTQTQSEPPEGHRDWAGARARPEAGRQGCICACRGLGGRRLGFHHCLLWGSSCPPTTPASASCSRPPHPTTLGYTSASSQPPTREEAAALLWKTSTSSRQDRDRAAPPRCLALPQGWDPRFLRAWREEG